MPQYIFTPCGDVFDQDTNRNVASFYDAPLGDDARTNARLFMASEDMLVALRRVAAGEDLTGTDDLLGAINAAIAKAEGKS